MTKKDNIQTNFAESENELFKIFKPLYNSLEFGEKQNYLNYVNSFLTPQKPIKTLYGYTSNFGRIDSNCKSFFENLLLTTIIQYTKEYFDRIHEANMTLLKNTESEFKKLIENGSSKSKNNKAGQSVPVK